MTDTQCNATNNKRIYLEGTNRLSHSRYLAGTAEREWKLHDQSPPPLRMASKSKHSMSWINSEIKRVFLFWGDPSRALDPGSPRSRCMSMKGGGGGGVRVQQHSPALPLLPSPRCYWTVLHAPLDQSRATTRAPSGVCSNGAGRASPAQQCLLSGCCYGA